MEVNVYLLFPQRMENKLWASSNCWKRVHHKNRKEPQSVEETSGWHGGKAVLRGWLQAGPNSAIGRCSEAGKETKWWRDYNVSRQAILCVICEGICLQIHPGYIFTPWFVLDQLPLSSQIGPFPEPILAFILILSHADKFRLDGCGRGGGSRGWVLNVSDTWGLIFGAKLGPFYQACLPSHLETRSEEQHFSPHQRALQRLLW